MFVLRDCIAIRKYEAILWAQMQSGVHTLSYNDARLV